MTGSTTDSDKPLRYACDRCHSQKLRCPRVVDPDGTNPDEPCSRCRKAGVACVVSLRGKVGRPSKVGKKKTTPRQPRTYLTPEMEFPSRESSMMLDGGDNDLGTAWSPAAEDRLVDMLDLDQDSRSLGATPKRFHEQKDGKTDQSQQSAYPEIPGSFGDSVAPPPMTPFDPFMMDFDADMDLPTFFIPTDIPSVLESPDLTNPTAAMRDIMQTPSIPNASHVSTMTSSNVSQPVLPISGVNTQKGTYSMLGLGQGPGDSRSSSPPPDFSSTACYHKLSDLNSRILSSAARRKPASNSSEILKEVVGFSGELIDTARHSMPYFIGSRPSSSRASTACRTDTSASQSEDGEASTDSGCSLSHSVKTDDWSSFRSQPTEASVPESAVIFLLLGCYTQILHLFEVTTNCLWDQHGEQAPQATTEENAGTVGSLLEASLAIHTVTYLLSRLHRAFAVQDSDTHLPDEMVDPQGWKRSFVGGKGLEDGLLGRAFGEIREREQWLMRRTQHLQERINSSHI